MSGAGRAGGFRFRLESVRRLREWEKARCTIELARRIGRVESLRRRLLELGRVHEREWEHVQAAGDTLDSAQLALYGAYARRTFEQMASCRSEIAEAEQEVEAARRAWNEAEQKLTLLEKLKEREMRAFERADGRREQTELDEVAGRQAVFSRAVAGTSGEVRHS